MSSSHVVDTIAAQATPAGRGGIAIIRVSGPKAKAIGLAMLGNELTPRQATHLPFRNTAGDILDEGVAVYFANPNSFTGEDVLELHGHGGPVVVDILLQHILTLGARLARPGEFSERAFLNGKMDLAQAEAVADLIDATSQQAAKLAVRSLQGEFSRVVTALTEKVIHLRMYIEAAIDFSDEEIDFLGDNKIADAIKSISSDLSAIQANARQGSFLREGITAVIAGEPNVGKSSLLNCLSGKELAIVTDIPGTTRDVLRDYVLIDGMPMHIVDTAGLRETDDLVEQEGVRRARYEIDNADLVLYVSDAVVASASGSRGQAAGRRSAIAMTPASNTASSPVNNTASSPAKAGDPVIHIRNKIDQSNEQPTITNDNNITTVSLSAKTGAGIDLLKQAIKDKVGYKNQSEGLYLARRRHLDALARAQMHVDSAVNQLENSKAGELAAEDLRLAQQAMSEITGQFTSDDLLGRIFSSFCIGK